jgi:hypothetical protein
MLGLISMIYSGSRAPSSGFSEWLAQQKNNEKKRSATKILHRPFQISSWRFK